MSESNVKVLIFRARKSLQALADAADLDCDDAQLALSARHDGECGRGEGARARLHAATCRSCRRFERAISTQATGLAALFPLAAVGLKTGGTLGGLFGAKAAAVAAPPSRWSAAAALRCTRRCTRSTERRLIRRRRSTLRRPAPGIAPISRPEHADDHPGRAGDDHGGNSGSRRRRRARGARPSGGGRGDRAAPTARTTGGRVRVGQDDVGGSGSATTSDGSGSGSSGSGSGSSGGSRELRRIRRLEAQRRVRRRLAPRAPASSCRTATATPWPAARAA